MPTKVKICCISSLKEAEQAAAAGAYALGLVGPMPSGPGIITDELIGTIAGQFNEQVKTFLLTSETQASEIIQHYQRAQTTTIQLVDSVEDGTYQALRTALPGVELVQVIHVLDQRSVDEALAAAEEVDVLLLDSGNPNLQVKELGGTGRTHDWSISKKIVEQAPVPVFLAGGLNSANVRRAIETVQPFGLDLCSGVRSNGSLDPVKLESFFNAIF